MDARQHQRVLPSNAPTFHELTTEQIHAQLPDLICGEYNEGRDCRVCKSRDHICSLCHKSDHGAFECPNFLNSTEPRGEATTQVEGNHCEISYPHYRFGPVPMFDHPPLHSAQAAIKREQTKRTTLPGVGAGAKLDRLAIERFSFERTEFRSSKYVTYREKQKNNKKKDNCGIWNDRVEYAFQKGKTWRNRFRVCVNQYFLALRLYGGRGRAKNSVFLTGSNENKLSGGNEWIAECIFVQTGVKVKRKQVSSHIQVLKGKMSHNPEWLELVKHIPPEKRGKKRDICGLSHVQERSFSEDDFVELSSPLDKEWPSIDEFTLDCPQSFTIHSARFGMYLMDKSGSCAEEASDDGSQFPTRRSLHHTYTVLQREMGPAPRSSDNLAGWKSAFPALETYDSYGNALPIFLFEAGLNLKDEYIPGSLVEIRLSLDIEGGSQFRDWHTRTQYISPYGCSDRRIDDTGGVTETGGILRLHCLKMYALYWVEVLSLLMMQRRRLTQAGHTEDERHAEDYSSRFLRSMLCMQQLWATPKAGNDQPKYVSTVLWRFHQVGRTERGITKWCQLFAPRSALQDESSSFTSTQEPLASQIPLPMAAIDQQLKSQQYDYGLEEYAFDYLPLKQENTELLPPPPELSRGNSPDSASQADFYSSLPNHTSHPYPCSTGSPSQPQLTRQESFHLQHSAGLHHSFDTVSSQTSAWSFDSQEDDFLLHATALTQADDQAFDANHPSYHIQRQHQQMHEGFSGYSSLENPSPSRYVGTQQDFNGGEVRLSFEELPHELAYQGDSGAFTLPGADHKTPSAMEHIDTIPIIQPELPRPDPQTMIRERLYILQSQHFEDLQEGRITELSNYDSFNELQDDHINELREHEEEAEQGHSRQFTADGLETQKYASSPVYNSLPRIDDHPLLPVINQSPLPLMTPNDDFDQQSVTDEGEAHVKLEEISANGQDAYCTSPLPKLAQQEIPIHNMPSDLQQNDSQMKDAQVMKFPSLGYEAPDVSHSIGQEATEYASLYIDVSCGQSPLVDDIDIQGWEHVEEFMKEKDGSESGIQG
ncbi:uncharacterized protein KY384_001535 [Bacidia gigantensis]|uniref:uncharacterized protein n=1 Tax=Bacidia gigantensis TaxID=2732470 RepID=UPI001D054E9B|nr:uncharacterized protein KY384_001535 [Bacidia gigantensis]KAG8533794.1 hypothetical protein KY384_001535 [Bacidia gigantensis]